MENKIVKSLNNTVIQLDTPGWLPLWLTNILYLDHVYSIRINRVSRHHMVQKCFSLISKIGDGSIWYVSCLALPIFSFFHGDTNLAVTQFVQLAGFAIVGASLYKLIKTLTNRPRPFIQHTQITLGCAPLDQWSFPSGHTLHAVGNTVLLTYHVPVLAWIYVPFAILVAASRPILGLHFPSDVLMGASIGAILASLMTFLTVAPF